MAKVAKKTTKTKAAKPAELPLTDAAPTEAVAGALLTELAALQRTLLGGGDPISVLQRLDGMLGSTPDSGSPPLLALLAAVRMRAKVELARRGWGPNR